MSKTTMTAAFAAMMAIAAPLAVAQTAATHASVGANHIMPGQIRATDMNGATVYDARNKNLGDVKDIVLDRDGRVAAVVLNVGSTVGIGGKLVAVPMSDLKVSFDNNNKPKFSISMTEDQLKSAQAYDLNPKNANTGSSTEPRNENNPNRR